MFIMRQIWVIWGFFKKNLSTSIITEIITSISFFNLKTHTSVQLLNVFLWNIFLLIHIFFIYHFKRRKYLWNIIVIEVFSACITAHESNMLHLSKTKTLNSFEGTLYQVKDIYEPNLILFYITYIEFWQRPHFRNFH